MCDIRTLDLEIHLSVKANNGARCAEHYLCQELACHEYACGRMSMLGTNVFTLDGPSKDLISRWEYL